jgi:ribonuclease HI
MVFDVLHEWSCMQRAKHPARPEDQHLIWTKPPVGHIKCNVDAAIFNNNTTMAYGLCFRDSSGALLMGKSEYLHLYVSVLEAESLGLPHSLKMAISNHLHYVTFETDSKSLADALKVHNVPLNEFGDLVTEIKSLLSGNPDYVVSFVRRQTNRVAHSIARAALSHPSPIFFMRYLILCTP